ncbi:hypothetical protein OAM08_02010 [Pelagibacteraceae bacterium]|nr:hypothetical protein [Pelagibacteraceae bacterium]
MIKSIKNTLFIIATSSLLIACGFKPLHQKFINKIYIQDIEITGERKAAYILENNILLFSNESSKNRFAINIQLTKDKKSKIKNKAGKVTRYGLLLTANMELKNLNDNRIIKKTFSQNGNYDVAKIYSNTISNENNITKNMIDIISNDIINFITISAGKE